MQSWKSKFILMREGARGILRRTALIGGLADCSVKNHVSACKEIFISLAFSTVAFWLTIIVFRLMVANSHKSLLELFKVTINNGELLIFAITFIGPVLAAALGDRQGKKRFPSQDWHVYLVLIIGGLSASFFVIIKLLKSMSTPTFDVLTQIDMPLLINCSIGLAAIAICTRYLAIVYQKNMFTSDEILPKQDAQFAELYAAHRSDK
nr:hypothetical protein [Janthinobacterium sp. Marseille]